MKSFFTLTKSEHIMTMSDDTPILCNLDRRDRWDIKDRQQITDP